MLIWAIFLAIAVSYSEQQDVTEEPKEEKKVACYAANWASGREGIYNFTAANVDPFLCTHIMYAFAKISPEEPILLPTDSKVDVEYGGYKSFTNLKLKNKDLKVLISVGGWAEGPATFSTIASDSAKRRMLVENILKFLKEYNFDGIDFDWQYPNDESRKGSSINDRGNYVVLIKEVRDAFEEEAIKTGNPRYVLSMVLPSKIEVVDKGYDIPSLTRYVDHFNLISYDYHLASDPTVQHHAPLYSKMVDEEDDPYESALNVDYSVRTIIKRGATPSKLNLGIPTYGRLFTLEDPTLTQIGAPAQGGGVGKTTTEVGVKLFYEICQEIKKDKWTVEYAEPRAPTMGAIEPHAFKDTLWVSYDDPESTKTKGEYARDMGLGGLMFWTIDYDDFLGECYEGRKYPVINAGKSAIFSIGRRQKNKKTIINRKKQMEKQKPSTSEPSTGQPSKLITTAETTPMPPTSKSLLEMVIPAESAPRSRERFPVSRTTKLSPRDPFNDSNMQSSDSLPASGKKGTSILSILFPNNVFFQDNVWLSYNVNIHKHDD